jgi:long-chain fatty acid transport protein
MPSNRPLPLLSTRLITAGLITAGLLAANTAYAGGLWISEFGDPSMGRASAGDQSGTKDAAAALHNPASMSALDRDQFMVSGGIIASDLKFDVDSSEPFNGTDNGGSAGGLAPGGSLFYVRGLNDRWTMGLYAGAFTGAVIDYNDQWVGRFQAQDVDLLVGGVVPSIAYKVTDRFAVGFTLPVMYSTLEMEIGLPGSNVNNSSAQLDGDDTQVGFGVSAYYELTDKTRFGMKYQSKFDFEYDGDIDIRNFQNSPKVSTDTELTLAAFIKGSVSHDFTDNFTGHLSVGWEEWSDMDNVLITGENDSAALEKDWDDIWNMAVGFEYKFAPKWSMNAGLRYDENPTEASKRTADMPIDEQIRYAYGLKYQHREDLTIGAHLVYADYGDGDIKSENSVDIPSPGPLQGDITVPTGFTGKYDTNDIYFFSVSVNWAL